MRYMVMECHLSYAVVLDENGRFLKVANRHYEVGQTVTDVIEMQQPQAAAQRRKTGGWVYSLAAMAACLLLVVTSVVQMGQMTYASVYMTINPEVRIDVNRSDVVVGLAGVNGDGEDLIQGYDYRKKDLDLVMDELVDRAIDMGYLHEGGQITLVLDAESEEWVVTHSNALTAHLNEHLEEKLSVTVEVTGGSAQNHQAVIPIDPGQTNYGESDYGETEPATQTTASTGPADSNYGDGQSSYTSDGGQSNYESDDGQSNYASDDGQSNYTSDDGQSNYTSDDGQSNYASDDGQSNYTSDDGQSDYASDDGQSGYDSDDGGSGYGSGEDDD